MKTAGLAVLALGLATGCLRMNDEDHGTGRLSTPKNVSAGITVVDTAGYVPMAWSPIYPNGKLELSRKSVRLAANSIVPKLDFKATDTGVTITIDPKETVDVYGGGEYEGGLRLNGQHVIFANFDNYVYRNKKHGLYQTYPWVIGVRKDGSAYGILVDCTFEGRVDVDKNGVVQFNFYGPIPRVIVIEKPNPADVVKGLAEITGPIELPPLWALGFHQSRWSYMTPKAAQDVAQNFRNRKIPADVIWFDIDYMEGFRVFTFNQKDFPNPKKVNDDLHALNFKTVWMIDPGVKDDPDNGYSVYDSGTEKDVWVKRSDNGKNYIASVWPGNCVFPDYTCEKAREWWRGLYKDYMATGMDGVWNDMNEPAWHHPPVGTKIDMDIDNQKAWFKGDGVIQPGPFRQHRNIYGFLMVRTSREGILRVRPDERPFILTRSNFIGGHRYAATWSGDNAASEKHMKLSIPMAIAMGISGQTLSGPDIGGFGGNGSTEMIRDWYTMAPFYPFSRSHTMKGARAKEPWTMGEAVEKSTKISLERRYRLMPYLYTLADEAARNGMPIMRPLIFLDPVNPNYRDEDCAFLFGGDLLVSPVWHKERAHLPKWPIVSITPGDLQDDRQAEVRIRPGSIVALSKTIPQHTGELDFGELELLICPDNNGNATGVIYEDETRNFDYKKGKFARSTITVKVVDGKVTNTSVKTEGTFSSKAAADLKKHKFTIIKH